MPVESDEGRHGQWLLNGHDLTHAATSAELLTWVEATMERSSAPSCPRTATGSSTSQPATTPTSTPAQLQRAVQTRSVQGNRSSYTERRTQRAERKAQRPHQALQRRTYRSPSAMRPSPGEHRVRLAPMAHRRRNHVGEARKPKPDLRCEVNMQGKEIAPSQCAQRGSASTHSTYLALAQEDSPRGQRGREAIAGRNAATTIKRATAVDIRYHCREGGTRQIKVVPCRTT